MQRIRRHLTFANITAVLALVVAMGGTAYAGGLITSKQIKNGTIKPVDLNVGTRTRAYTTSVASAALSAVNSQPAEVASLTIPHTGDYVVIATLNLTNTDPNLTTYIACQLAQNPIGSATDGKQVGLTKSGTDQYSAPMTLQITQHFKANDVVQLLCVNMANLGGQPEADAVTVTAISVNSLATPGP